MKNRTRTRILAAAAALALTATGFLAGRATGPDCGTAIEAADHTIAVLVAGGDADLGTYKTHRAECAGTEIR